MSNFDQPLRRDPKARKDQDPARTQPEDGSLSQKNPGAAPHGGTGKSADAQFRAASPDGRSGLGSSTPSGTPASGKGGSVTDALSDLADCIDSLAREVPRGSNADLQGVRKKLADARETIRSCGSSSSARDARDVDAEIPNRDSSVRSAF
jgi:hypothetical protein